jgi:hypothetical protein
VSRPGIGIVFTLVFLLSPVLMVAVLVIGCVDFVLGMLATLRWIVAGREDDRPAVPRE